MSMLSPQVGELRMLAGDGSMEFVAGPIRASVLLDAADTIEQLSAKLQGVMGTRYAELFGTPERAARTLQPDSMSCKYCLLRDYCKDGVCLIEDYDALLEWLRGES